MAIPHRELAKSQAARFAINNIEKHISRSSSTIKQPEEAIIPVFGIRWDTQVIRRVGSKRLCGILAFIRNSKAPQATYNKVRDLWKSGVGNDSDPPQHGGNWRTLLERFNLGDELRIGEWAPIIDTLVKNGWADPNSLARATAAEFTALSTVNTSPPLAQQLWRDCALVYSDISEGQLQNIKGISANAETLLSRIKAPSIADSAIRRDVSSSHSKLRMPKSFHHLGSDAKLAKLRLASVSKLKIRRFPRTSSQMNALLGVRFCFRSFASAIRLYFSFFELRQVNPFPVREKIVPERSSIFNPFGTFANYVLYLKKACFFPDLPITWWSPAVTNSTRSLRLAGKGEYRFPNFISIGMVTAIIKHESKHLEFAQLSYIAFLFALRVPSEALVPQRA